MTFRNDAEFQDDFRKVGDDVTAGFERPGAPSDPTDHASSKNLELAPNSDEPDDDADDIEDEDVEDDDADDLDEPEDEDLEDEDEDELEDDDEEFEDDDEDLDDEDDDDDEPEDDDTTKVASRLAEAETRARNR